MSGLELLAALRQEPAYATMPAIFLSGRIEAGDIAAGKALGATYLTKPVVFTALVKAIDDALQPVAAPAGGW
jgi:CheY-like chemotaxis protein